MTRIQTALFCGLTWLGGLGLSMVAGNSKEAMQVYAFVLCLLSCVAVLSRTAKAPRYLLSCYTVVMLAPIWFLYLEAVFQGGDAWLLPADKVIQTLSYAAFFLTVFNLAYVAKPSAKILRLHDKYFLRVLRPSLLPAVGVTVFLVTVAVILIRYNFSLEWISRVYLAGRASGEGIIRRGGLGGLEVFLQPLDFMCSAIPTIAALSWVRFQQERLAPLNLRIGVTFCAAVLVFMTFLGGSRGAMAVYIAGPAAVWILFGRRWVGKVPHFLVTVLLFLALIGLWEYQKRNRSNLLGGVTSVSEIVERTSFDPSETHRDNNLYIFTLYNMYMPEPFPFEGFHELYVLAVNPIPRAIWPGKPKSQHMQMMERLGKGAGIAHAAPGPVLRGPLHITTFSLTQSIVGDGFKMYHYFGIAAWGIIFGLLASFWDSIGQRRYLATKLYFILQAAWLFWLLWGFRAGFALVTGMYTVWAAYLMCFIAGKFGYPIALPAAKQVVTNIAGTRRQQFVRHRRQPEGDVGPGSVQRSPSDV